MIAQALVDLGFPRPIPAGDCLLWAGPLTKHGGYGRIRRRGYPERAHRAVYEMVHGPIPEGKVVRHTCDTSACVNPDHLILGTQKENMADRDARGGTANARKTHCIRGHELTGDNLIVTRKGTRGCRQCKRARERHPAYCEEAASRLARIS